MMSDESSDVFESHPVEDATTKVPVETIDQSLSVLPNNQELKNVNARYLN